jgi:hypothetical protein
MDLEKEINLIKERNKRVETDKAWETSWERLLLISAILYITALIFMIIIGVQNVLLAALVPVLGFALSNQSLPVVKRWWLKNKSSKNQ